MTANIFINTLLEQGGGGTDKWNNRFNGIPRVTEPLKRLPFATGYLHPAEAGC